VTGSERELEGVQQLCSVSHSSRDHHRRIDKILGHIARASRSGAHRGHQRIVARRYNVSKTELHQPAHAPS
jgi:hypothetical protein